jgi:alpha-L-fucosidase
VYPEIFGHLGWCSWEHYRREITAERLADAVRRIHHSEVPVRWVLVDDGYYETMPPDARLRDYPLRSLAPAPEKFPEGWEKVLAERREDGVRWFGLWQNFNGYWARIALANQLGPALNAHLMDVPAGGVLPKASLPDATAWFEAMIGSARKAGFDFVKVDDQARSFHNYKGVANPVMAAAFCSQALERTAAAQVNGLINCMAHGPVNAFNTALSVVTRCSEDYEVNNAWRAKAHLHNSYQNMLWLGPTVWGDHDMFHSSDRFAGTMMAVSKALSGGPVYLSDDPADFDPKLIRSLCFDDGKLLRPLSPAVPLPRCVTLDPFEQAEPYLVAAPLPNDAVAVVAYNLTEPTQPVKGEIRPRDYQDGAGLLNPSNRVRREPREGLVLYNWKTKEATRLEGPLDFTLETFDDCLILLIPIRCGWAVIGRADKFLSPAGVHVLHVKDTEIVLEVLEAGPVTLWRDGETLVVQAVPGVLRVSAEQFARDVRLRWWREARFSMFVHWGIFSLPGGEWRGQDYGKEMGGRSAEWIMLTADIPESEYRKMALEFNPVDYHPRAWAKAAREAGMGYVVLTTKHHDGFCLFPTAANPWNVVEATTCGRDLLLPYVEALRAEGLRVGFYYSHRIDWVSRHRAEHHEPMPLTPEYLDVVGTHLTELCTRYGSIDLFWFDMGMDADQPLNQLCLDIVRKHQPQAVVSERIGSGLGDYRSLPDRALPPVGTSGDCESPMTLRMNWGYDRDDISWKSPTMSVAMLSQCACRGANFLLNMAPEPGGRFTPEETVSLQFLAAWMKDNGDAIRATTGSPFPGEFSWGSMTVKNDGTHAFLHVWNYDEDCDLPLEIDGFTAPVVAMQVLGLGISLPFTQETSQACLTTTLSAPTLNAWTKRHVAPRLNDVPSWLMPAVQLPLIVSMEFQRPLDLERDIHRDRDPRSSEPKSPESLKTYPLRAKVTQVLAESLHLTKTNGGKLKVFSRNVRCFDSAGREIAGESLHDGCDVLVVLSPHHSDPQFRLQAEKIVLQPEEIPSNPVQTDSK